ncbi:DUF1553 domain-containing protein [soil metagenome]
MKISRNIKLFTFFLGSLVLLFICFRAVKNIEKVDKDYQDITSEKIDYNFHVKPILSDRCFACHGPDKNKRSGDLRLDTPEGAFALLGDNKDHTAIIPGDTKNSELIKRINSNDPEYMMPPPESHLSLSPEDKELLTAWIKQGAEYKPHWSFIPPEKPKFPQVNEEKWVKNPIDAFVVAKLEQEGFSPAPEADKETLIRRVSFDLTGLPPTIAAIDSFINDKSPEAFEKLVDKYLRSKAYGERMASDWMDVARFADSHGYLDDKHRAMWPWRDWVIKAFNENLPYDQFLTYQIAGDLLPQATKEQILATGFNRNHKQNSEAGIIDEEFLVEYAADRTHTVAKAFLGLSLECARCHDHKYDPISQKEYYQFFGFFNSNFERGSPNYGGEDQVPGPTLLLSDEETDQKVAFIKKTISIEEQKLQNIKDKIGNNFSSQPSKIFDEQINQTLSKKIIAHFPFDDLKGKNTENKVDKLKSAKVSDVQLIQGKSGNAFQIEEESSIIIPKPLGYFERTDFFSVSLWVKVPKIFDVATVFYNTDHNRYGYKGYDLQLLQNKLSFRLSHSWPHNTVHVTSREALPVDEWTHIVISYDGSSQAKGIKIYVNGKAATLDTVYDNLYKSIRPMPNIHIVTQYRGFTLGKREIDKGFATGMVDELFLFDDELSGLEVQKLFNPGEELNFNLVTNLENHKKEFYFLNNDTEARQARRKLQNLRKQEHELLDSIPEIMVMGDLPEPKPTFVLERGEYDAYRERVEPGTPENILSFPENLPRNRLGLAQWLLLPENPLTGRVAVNRIWQMHFGKGLVVSSDDFGNQGSIPSHPELLDWLAVNFIENGYNLKALHKLILTSATYRQSSAIPPALLEADPENKLLGRAPRYRFPAEMIRDNALASSGLLVRRIGGPSVYPYQPDGLWEALSNKSWRYNYTQDKGEGLYRRSFYTVWKRTAPPPSMLIFDAPDRNTCVVRRETTSTPLQALVLLNDPQYVEAAKFVGERMITEAGADLEDQLIYGYRLLTGRKPRKKELNLLIQLYEEEKDNFERNPAALKQYLSVGEMKTEKNLDQVKTGAFAVVASAIMNTDEFYTKK